MYFSTASKASFLVLFSLTRGAVLQSRSSASGQATFYGGNLQGGTCSFSTYTLPDGMYGTALSDANWDNAGNCGACVSVTGPSGSSIKAMIVDQCPGCGLNHLDLFPDAFASLATPSTGIIPVAWNFVDCGLSSALQLHNKEGVSAYWFSMQVVNADRAVASLEVSTDGGSTWASTTRQPYNFFENQHGFGTTTVDVRVTSVDGDVVVVNAVNVVPGTSVTAPCNFGPARAPPAGPSSAASSQTPRREETSTPTSSAPAKTAPPPPPPSSSSPTTDSGGVFESVVSSTNVALPSMTETASTPDVESATTLEACGTPTAPTSTPEITATETASATASEAMSIVTVYVYETCAP